MFYRYACTRCYIALTVQCTPIPYLAAAPSFSVTGYKTSLYKNSPYASDHQFAIRMLGWRIAEETSYPYRHALSPPSGQSAKWDHTRSGPSESMTGPGVCVGCVGGQWASPLARTARPVCRRRRVGGRLEKACVGRRQPPVDCGSGGGHWWRSLCLSSAASWSAWAPCCCWWCWCRCWCRRPLPGRWPDTTGSMPSRRSCSPCRARRHRWVGTAADGTAPPADGTAPPTDGTAPPADGTAPPAHSTAPPADSTAPPADGTAPPADGTAPPADGTAPPADGTAPPAHSTAPPADGTAPPADGTAPPADGTAPPADGTAPPAHSTAPPADSTAPPADSTAPPADGTAPHCIIRIHTDSSTAPHCIIRIHRIIRMIWFDNVQITELALRPNFKGVFGRVTSIDINCLWLYSESAAPPPHANGLARVLYRFPAEHATPGKRLFIPPYQPNAKVAREAVFKSC